MGYYIEVPRSKGKAQQIEDLYGGMILPKIPDYANIPESKALICIVDNGMFEAAGFVYNEQEYNAFAYPDGRPRTWLIMDRETAEKLSGFSG